jgi:hypothetical protein
VSVPSFDLLPTFQEETNFLLATNQGCESSGLSHIKATGGTTVLENAVHVEGLSHPSERLGSQVLTREISLD